MSKQSKRPLVVYAMMLSSAKEDNLPLRPDGRPHRQVRAIVATRTKKEAIALFGCTAGEFREYSSKTSNAIDLEVALAKPGQLFVRRIDDWDGNYLPSSRSPHVPLPRVKGPSKPLSQRPQRLLPVAKFTRNELEMIRDHFAMANDSDGLGIAEKAQLMLENTP
jgi:hypothetical protein